MAIKYIEHQDQLTKLSRKVVRVHPWGFQGATIEGARGRGKSGFCLHTMREVTQYIDGISRDDAWEKILAVGNYKQNTPLILFSMNDVIDSLELLDSIDMKNILEWQRENTTPVKTWDDAGMHGGKYKFFVNVRIVDYLKGLMDTMRFVTSGFLINAPELSGLLGFIREYRDQLIIEIGYRTDGIRAGGEYGRVAIVRKYIRDRSGRKRLRKDFETKFSCYVDKWAYAEYSRMEAKAIIENRIALKKIATEAEKQETDKDPYDVIGVPEEYKDIISS